MVSGQTPTQFFPKKKTQNMATTTTKISLKLLVDEKAKKVLFAEAGKDFIDFLFGLLQMPLGSIAGLLINEVMIDSGSLVKIYESVENLDPTYLQPNQNKESLLNPKPSSSSTLITPSLLTNLLPQQQEPKKKVLFNNYDDGCAYYPCRSAAATTRGEGGYVKGMVTYMVMDDLEVKPMSSISSITLLNAFHVKDVSKLQERTVEVDNLKALELMKALFDPSRDTVLTDVFITKKTTPVAAG